MLYQSGNKHSQIECVVLSPGDAESEGRFRASSPGVGGMYGLSRFLPEPAVQPLGNTKRR